MPNNKEKKLGEKEAQVSCRVPESTSNQFVGMLKMKGTSAQEVLSAFIERVLAGKEPILRPGEEPPKMPSKKDLEKDPLLAEVVQCVVRMFMESPLEFEVLRLQMGAWEQAFAARKRPI